MSKARQLADNGASTPNKNILINGAMNVAQRGTSSTGIGASSGYFTCDRWLIACSGEGRLTATQTADGPVGFANCLKLDCTTADTSIAAGEFLQVVQKIEGQNLQRIGKGVSGAKEITVSFYVKANAAFNFVCELNDLDNTRHISKLFATTTGWVKHELTFAADEDDGSSPFDDDNAASLNLTFWLHAGSTWSGGTLNTATFANTTNANRAAGVSSFFSSTNNEFFITGVQLEVGSSATPFEHKTFGQDLIECQRYYTQETAASGSAYKRFGGGSWNTSTAGAVFIPLSTPMRDSSPTLVSKAAASYLVYSANATDACTALIINSESNNGTNSRIVALNFSTSSGGVAGEALQLVGNNDTASYLAIDAEL